MSPNLTLFPVRTGEGRSGTRDGEYPGMIWEQIYWERAKEQVKPVDLNENNKKLYKTFQKCDIFRRIFFNVTITPCMKENNKTFARVLSFLPTMNNLSIWSNDGLDHMFKTIYLRLLWNRSLIFLSLITLWQSLIKGWTRSIANHEGRTNIKGEREV